MKKREIYIYVGVIFIMLIYVSMSLMMEYLGSKLLPLIISTSAIVLAGIGIAKNTAGINSKKTIVIQNGGTNEKESRESWRRYFFTFYWLIGLLVAVYFIGFTISVPLFIFCYMKGHRTRWKTAIISAILVGGIIYGVFGLLLGINMLEGIIFDFLYW